MLAPESAGKLRPDATKCDYARCFRLFRSFRPFSPLGKPESLESPLSCPTPRTHSLHPGISELLHIVRHLANSHHDLATSPCRSPEACTSLYTAKYMESDAHLILMECFALSRISPLPRPEYTFTYTSSAVGSTPQSTRESQSQAGDWSGTKVNRRVRYHRPSRVYIARVGLL